MIEILRVGTDCSGIEAPIQALRLLGVPYRHIFSSEIDDYCIQSIKANYEPEILYGDRQGPYPNGDITKRDHSTLPDIDLYVCGFPCQPFSVAGHKQGFDDHRGNVFWSCLETIQVKQPKYFILENVKGLLHHEKGKTWDVIWKALSDLQSYGYTIKWKVLNTKDYGIPQNRERVYMVGVKNGNFDWPEPVEMDDIKLYVDWSNKNKYKTTEKHTKYLEKFTNNTFISFLFINYKNNPNPNCCQCINVKPEMWCVPLERYATCKELMQLQGLDLKQVVSDTQFRKQIGNSMSVNVLCALLANMIDI
jgi:DNA (cytosine-5)-methyltransferase 1